MSAPDPAAPPSDPSRPSGEVGSYRTMVRAGPDPVTETDAIVELLQRSHALRRKLLMVTIAASMLGGVLGLVLYMALALRVYGRVAGFFYAAGAALTFALVHRLCRKIARLREARWTAELARRHKLDEAPLLEAVGVLE